MAILKCSSDFEITKLNTFRYGLLFFISFVISCETLEVADFQHYPVKIDSIEENELVQLNERYQSENGDRICSTLNEFGLTGFSRVLFPNDINPCLEREVVRVELLNPDSLITVAKETLVQNKEFTMVEDTLDLSVEEVLPLYGCTICEGPEINSVVIEWKISFSGQKFGNAPVRDSGITVFIDALGVNRIWGNWYPEFEAPGFINVGYVEALNMLEGWEINMEPYTGESITFVVQKENLSEEPVFELVPYVNDVTLELRRTWRVPISYKDDSFEGWNASVDVYDGLLLDILAKQSTEEI